MKTEITERLELAAHGLTETNDCYLIFYQIDKEGEFVGEIKLIIPFASTAEALGNSICDAARVLNKQLELKGIYQVPVGF